jgi:hypothetical protein
MNDQLITDLPNGLLKMAHPKARRAENEQYSRRRDFVLNSAMLRSVGRHPRRW